MNVFRKIIAKIYRRKITKLVMKIDDEDVLEKLYSIMLEMFEEEKSNL